MKQRARRVLYAIAIVLTLTLLAAPARGAEWFGVQVGSGGLSIAFGSNNWAVYGSSWSNPNWQVDYHVALSGYGNWVWVDGLGQCWRPMVAVGWRPYTHGRWVWSSYGWTWVAYEPWGFFPHHFGHWAMSHQGWVWVPGYTYRPANVTWVTAGGYVGWYACPPPGWSHAAMGYGRGYDHGYRRGYQNGYRGGYDNGYWSGWNDARYATYSQWNNFGAEDLSKHAVTASTVRASAGAQPRIVTGVPDRPTLARRGVVLPEKTMETRTVRVDSREVLIARPSGVHDMVQRHGGRTVERALATQGRAAVQKQSTRGRVSTHSVSNDRGSTPPRTTRAARGSASEVRESATKNSTRATPRIAVKQPTDGVRRSASTARASASEKRSSSSKRAATSKPASQRPDLRIVPSSARSDATAHSVRHDKPSRMVATNDPTRSRGAKAEDNVDRNRSVPRTQAKVSTKSGRSSKPATERSRSGNSQRSRENTTHTSRQR